MLIVNSREFQDTSGRMMRSIKDDIVFVANNSYPNGSFIAMSIEQFSTICKDIDTLDKVRSADNEVRRGISDRYKLISRKRKLYETKL